MAVFPRVIESCNDHWACNTQMWTAEKNIEWHCHVDENIENYTQESVYVYKIVYIRF